MILMSLLRTHYDDSETTSSGSSGMYVCLFVCLLAAHHYHTSVDKMIAVNEAIDRALQTMHDEGVPQLYEQVPAQIHTIIVTC